MIIHTPALDVLLLERADHCGFWQSVTGSRDTLQEPFAETARRELLEETGLSAPASDWRDWQLSNVYEIYPGWRHRYAPDVTHNTEHVFSVCVPATGGVRIDPREHTAWQWLPYQEAAERCYSPSNAEAILLLPRFALPQPA